LGAERVLQLVVERVRIAAVTGASRGIGRATALELARRGYRVFALARSLPDLEALARVAEADGRQILPVVMDIADAEQRAAAVESVMTQTDGYGLDVLVNNAGYGQIGPLEEVPPERLRRQLDVNVVAPLAFTQPFLPGMRARRRGYVVNISSASGRVATPFMGAYNASKFALEGMSDALRLELSPFGVRVILIEPGPVPTDFGRVAETEAVVDAASPYERYYRRFRSTYDVGRAFARTPQTVARVIADAIEAERPRARFTITPPAKLALLARFVPGRLLDWGYRLVMGLR
jgi:NAD(P)-dependent dehydrogenase (short-subunit alcohol dehydrogenase family)